MLLRAAQKEMMIKLNSLHFSVEMNSIPCGSTLTAEMWDDPRRMFRWQREEIKVRNEERGQFLCGDINAEHSLMGLWREKHRKWSSVEVSNFLTHQDTGQSTCPYLSVQFDTFDGHIWLMWLIRVTVRACCIHQPRCGWVIYSETFTDADSWKTWPPASCTIMQWWITPKHVSMMRQANNTECWQGAVSSYFFEVSNIIFYTDVKGVRVFSDRSVNTQLCVCVVFTVCEYTCVKVLRGSASSLVYLLCQPTSRPRPQGKHHISAPTEEAFTGSRPEPLPPE